MNTQNLIIALSLIATMSSTVSIKCNARRLADRIKNGERVTCAMNFIIDLRRTEPSMMREIDGAVKI